MAIPIYCCQRIFQCSFVHLLKFGNRKAVQAFNRKRLNHLNRPETVLFWAPFASKEQSESGAAKLGLQGS